MTDSSNGEEYLIRQYVHHARRRLGELTLGQQSSPPIANVSPTSVEPTRSLPGPSPSLTGSSSEEVDLDLPLQGNVVQHKPSSTTTHTRQASLLRWHTPRVTTITRTNSEARLKSERSQRWTDTRVHRASVENEGVQLHQILDHAPSNVTWDYKTTPQPMPEEDERFAHTLGPLRGHQPTASASTDGIQTAPRSAEQYAARPAKATPKQSSNTRPDGQGTLHELIRRAVTLASGLEMNGKRSSDRSLPRKRLASPDRPSTSRQSGSALASVLAVLPFNLQRGADPLRSQQSHDALSSYAEKSVRWTQVRKEHPNIGEPPSLTEEPADPRRRIFGLRPLVLAFLLVAVLVVVTLAIALPLALTNRPTEHQASGCAASAPCANGGVSIATGNETCQCLCASNFTGSRCAVSDAKDPCTTVQTYLISDATAGSELSDLLYNADEYYSVPLNATVILPVLNANGLDCASQNALVSLSGADSRDASSSQINQPQSRLDTAQIATTTTDGLVVVVTVPPSTLSSTIWSPTPTSIGPSATPTFAPSSSKAQGFAQAAILLVVQRYHGVGEAQEAQKRLQALWATPKSGGSVTAYPLGNGWYADMTNFGLLSPEGHIIGDYEGRID